MKKIILILQTLFLAGILLAENQAPVVSNIRAMQLEPLDLKLVEIVYDVVDAEEDTLLIMVRCSDDGGITWDVPIISVDGDIHDGVTPGLDKNIIWDAGADYNNSFSENMRIKVAAYDHQLDLIRVSGGTFTMGDSICGPEHDVTLTSDFELSRFSITNLEFRERLQWAYDSGLIEADEDSAWDIESGKGIMHFNVPYSYCEIYNDNGIFCLRESPTILAQNSYPDGYDPYNFPVKKVIWWGTALFCNWLSMIDGLSPAYNVVTWECGPDGIPYAAEGYRLPTEAEREYAAQYNDGRLYPWGDDPVNFNFANYGHSVGWPSAMNRYSPLGDSYLGFIDLAGNTWDWCNDWKGPYSSASQINPCGPSGGTDFKIIRGCSWESVPYYSECSARAWDRVYRNDYTVGFRVCRTIQTED